MENTAATAPTQGIMTNEAGAITGDVTITTTDTPGGVETSVGYTGAAENYTVTGSPAPAGTSHAAIVERLLIDTGEPTALS